ncbi:unnamed protein product [Didymodactylos carnosus]|uniref:Dynein light chain n=1 Tax=Didymodactylos carnosus TaxID=1234261 RepID=A0A814MYA6_9BILA|nr:unnamed protein product [Didymodactylos carnosus]CAF1084972.1 unnamed protein product [Didymodactylos carnosus]CAF3740586.1 unnamed protein product [Didymodactylos carnosus]CAF3850590.1 unnamed protein product [Didymodactylos carnosus]
MSIISSRNSSGGVPIVREANMLKPVQQESINIAQQAIKKYGGYHVGQRSNIAKQIQSDMNRKYGRHWQCIVGNDYGSAIAFKKQNHIVFQIDRAFITLFKGVC